MISLYVYTLRRMNGRLSGALFPEEMIEDGVLNARCHYYYHCCSHRLFCYWCWRCRIFVSGSALFCHNGIHNNWNGSFGFWFCQFLHTIHTNSLSHGMTCNGIFYRRNTTKRSESKRDLAMLPTIFFTQPAEKAAFCYWVKKK